MRTFGLRALALAAATGLAVTIGATPASALVSQTKVFVADVNGSVGVLNATTGSTTFKGDYLGGIPVDMVANPNGNFLYYVDTMDDGIGVLDTAAESALGWVQVCDRPQSAALNPSTATLYVSCNGSNGGTDSAIDVVDVGNPNALRVTATVALPSWPYQAVADPAMNLLLVDQANGIAEISMATNKQVGFVQVAPGSLSLSPTSPVLYDATGNDVYGIDLTDGEVFQGIPLAMGAGSAALCAIANTLYVVGNGGISQINLATSTVTRTYPVTGSNLQLSADCGTAFVVSGNSVVALNTATGATTTTPSPTHGITAMAVATVHVGRRPPR